MLLFINKNINFSRSFQASIMVGSGATPRRTTVLLNHAHNQRQPMTAESSTPLIKLL